jgi:penicillin amidase
MGHDWYGDTRARRIRQLLDAHPKASIADFAAMQFDDLDLTAKALLPRLAAIEPRLTQWDGRADRDRPEPLIFNAWMIGFHRQLLASLDAADSGAAAPWPDLVTAALTPGNTLCGDGCDAMLRSSHDRAMAELTRRFGPDPAAWRWGAAHEAVFATLALRAIPVVGGWAEGRIAQSGDDSTLQRGGVQPNTLESIHGAAYRGVYDLSDLERSRFILSPGQSGNPVSDFARNLMGKWRDGDTISISAVPQSVSVSIRLVP